MSRDPAPPCFRHTGYVTTCWRSPCGRSDSMRRSVLSVPLLVAMSAAALFQLSPNGARAGNDPLGGSVTMDSRAMTLALDKTRSTVVPALPSPPGGDEQRASDYLKAAQGALAAGLYRRGATGAGDGANPNAGPIGADGTDQQPKRQPDRAADFRRASGPGIARSRHLHAVD